MPFPGEGGHGLLLGGQDVGDDVAEQLFLALHVVVEAGLREADALADGVERGPLETHLGDHLGRRPHDQIPAGLPAPFPPLLGEGRLGAHTRRQGLRAGSLARREFRDEATFPPRCSWPRSAAAAAWPASGTAAGAPAARGRAGLPAVPGRQHLARRRQRPARPCPVGGLDHLHGRARAAPPPGLRAQWRRPALRDPLHGGAGSAPEGGRSPSTTPTRATAGPTPSGRPRRSRAAPTPTPSSSTRTPACSTSSSPPTGTAATPPPGRAPSGICAATPCAPAGWTSADAAGLPILPGLLRRDEVAAGTVDHAIRLTASRTDKSFLWPARHQAGAAANPSLPPMGAWFRLQGGLRHAPASGPTRRWCCGPCSATA